MQTWYGIYYVPSHLHVTEQDVDVWQYAAHEDYRNKIDAEYGTKDKTPGTLDGTEDIFLKDGYLVLNFDIYTINDGKAHLKYYGNNDGATDQWKIQGGKTTTNVGVTGNNPGRKQISIPLKSGDVAIIDMGNDRNDDVVISDVVLSHG